MHRRGSAPLACVVIALAAGCSAGAAPPTSTTASPTSSNPPPAASASANPSSQAAGPSVAACTSYANATANPRQVVMTASSKPISGAAAALALVNIRTIAAGVSLPADPPLTAAFAELVASVDDLANQLDAGLPAGADPVTTVVSADPARLKRALDAADGLCAAAGVAPKAG